MKLTEKQVSDRTFSFLDTLERSIVKQQEENTRILVNIAKLRTEMRDSRPPISTDELAEKIKGLKN